MQKLASRTSALLPALRLFVCCLVLYSGVARAAPDHGDSAPAQEPAESTDVSDASINKSAAGHPDFSGSWKLDKSASDDPEEIIKASRNKRKKTAFFPGGDMPGHGNGMGRSGFGGPSPGDMDDKHPPAALLVVHLEIFHSDPELRVVADQIDKQTIYTDFRSTSISTRGGPQQKVVIAGWEGSELVIETRTLGGSAMIQRLRLLEDPRRLERVTEIPSPDPDEESIVIKQVFNPWTR